MKRQRDFLQLCGEGAFHSACFNEKGKVQVSLEYFFVEFLSSSWRKFETFNIPVLICASFGISNFLLTALGASCSPVISYKFLFNKPSSSVTSFPSALLTLMEKPEDQTSEKDKKSLLWNRISTCNFWLVALEL